MADWRQRGASAAQAFDEIFSPQNWVDSTKKYVIDPYVQNVAKPTDQFLQGVFLGPEKPPPPPSGGYKPGLYSPGPMSRPTDPPVPAASAPTALPRDNSVLFEATLPGSGGRGGGRVPAFSQSYLNPADYMNVPVPPQRTVDTTPIDFSEEERAVEALRPGQPKDVGWQDVAIRAVLGALIGGATGGTGGLVAGAAGGLLFGLTEQGRREHEYNDAMKTYLEKVAGFASKKRTERTADRRQDEQDAFANVTSLYERDKAQAEIARQISLKNKAIESSNLRAQMAARLAEARSAGQSGKTSMSLVGNRLVVKGVDQNGNQTIKVVAMDPVLEAAERQAKLGAATQGSVPKAVLGSSIATANLPVQFRPYVDALNTLKISGSPEYYQKLAEAKRQVLLDMGLDPDYMSDSMDPQLDARVEKQAATMTDYAFLNLFMQNPGVEEEILLFPDASGE